MSSDPNDRTMPDTPAAGYPPGNPPPPPYSQPPGYPRPKQGRSPISIFLIIVLVILCCLTTVVAGAAGYLLLGNSTTVQQPGGPIVAQQTAVIQPTADEPSEEEPTTPPSATQRPTATIRPTATRSLTATAGADCGARASRLETGDEARVVVFQVSIRDQPGTDQTRLNVAAEGAILRVLEGPTCHQDGYWWYVQTEQGDFGWVLEGDAENYYLEPQ
jgi:hypothetical protein